MKRLVLATFAALALVLGNVAASAETIKLGTLAPDGSPCHRILRDRAGAWKSASNGEIELHIYAGGEGGCFPMAMRDRGTAAFAAL